MLTLPHMMQSALSTSALGVLLSGQPESFLYVAAVPSPSAVAAAAAGAAAVPELLLLLLKKLASAPASGVSGTRRPYRMAEMHRSCLVVFITVMCYVTM
jgi:hypothetical protein